MAVFRRNSSKLALCDERYQDADGNPLIPADSPLIKARQQRELTQEFLTGMVGFIPLREGSKVPAGKFAAGGQFDRLEQVSQTTFGVVPRQRTVILDIDYGRFGEVDVDCAVRLLTEEVGLPLNKTFSVRTPSGGRHFYLVWPSNVPLPRNGKLGNMDFSGGLRIAGDIRAAGVRGYCVGAGSIVQGAVYAVDSCDYPAFVETRDAMDFINRFPVRRDYSRELFDGILPLDEKPLVEIQKSSLICVEGSLGYSTRITSVTLSHEWKEEHTREPSSLFSGVSFTEPDRGISENQSGVNSGIDSAIGSGIVTDIDSDVSTSSSAASSSTRITYPGPSSELSSEGSSSQSRIRTLKNSDRAAFNRVCRRLSRWSADQLSTPYYIQRAKVYRMLSCCESDAGILAFWREMGIDRDTAKSRKISTYLLKNELLRLMPSSGHSGICGGQRKANAKGSRSRVKATPATTPHAADAAAGRTSTPEHSNTASLKRGRGRPKNGVRNTTLPRRRNAYSNTYRTPRVLSPRKFADMMGPAPSKAKAARHALAIRIFEEVVQTWANVGVQNVLLSEDFLAAHLGTSPGRARGARDFMVKQGVLSLTKSGTRSGYATAFRVNEELIDVYRTPVLVARTMDTGRPLVVSRDGTMVCPETGEVQPDKLNLPPVRESLRSSFPARRGTGRRNFAYMYSASA